MNAPEPEPTLRGFAAGQRAFGRYTLLRPLGRGGMSVVWAARDETLGEEVALKFLPDALRWDSVAFGELKREAKRARQLTHPNIVRVHDFAEDAGAAAISMELVAGCTLAGLRSRQPGGVFAPADILPWLSQLAAALDHAHHAAGIVHRDLKPANLMLTDAGTLKIADFGVARSVADAATRTSGFAAGTAVYMSPQQALGEVPATSDDIYALGATLYELLAGRPPFHTGDVQLQLLHRTPESIASRRREAGIAGAEIPREWEETIAACLAKRAEDRPRSAGAVAAALSAAPAKRSVRQARLSGGAGRAQPRRVAALLALVGLAVVAAWWWGGTRVKTEANPGAEPAAPAGGEAAEWTEDFSSGLAGWVEWGEPRPRRLEGFQGRSPVLDNNGDGMHASGLTSKASIAAPRGFRLESEVFLAITDPAGCHASAAVGRTLDAGRWMDALGTSGDGGDGVSLRLDFVGDACWNEPAAWNRHLVVRADYTDENGMRRQLADEVGAPGLYADEWMNRWAALRIEVDAERRARFFVGERLVWAPGRPVHPRVLQAQRVVVLGQSAGSAGKAFHGTVRMRAAAGGALVAAAAATKHAEGAAPVLVVPFNREDWRLEPRPADADEWFRKSRVHPDLLLSAAGGGAQTLASERVFLPGEALLVFDVQPWLQSDAAGADSLRVGMAETEGGERRGRFLGFEFSGGQIWAVDTAQRAAERGRLRRLGSYAPGRWEQFNLRRRSDGRLELLGGRVNAFVFLPSPPAAAPWRIVLAASATTDGARLGPVRLAAPVEARK